MSRTIKLKSGNELHATSDIVGIDGEFNVYSGTDDSGMGLRGPKGNELCYDGGGEEIYRREEWPQHYSDDAIELADLMIARWTEFKRKASKPRPK